VEFLIVGQIWSFEFKHCLSKLDAEGFWIARSALVCGFKFSRFFMDRWEFSVSCACGLRKYLCAVLMDKVGLGVLSDG
jgi:hypothetical protein